MALLWPVQVFIILGFEELSTAVAGTQHECCVQLEGTAVALYERNC